MKETYFSKGESTSASIVSPPSPVVWKCTSRTTTTTTTTTTLPSMRFGGGKRKGSSSSWRPKNRPRGWVVSIFFCLHANLASFRRGSLHRLALTCHVVHQRRSLIGWGLFLRVGKKGARPFESTLLLYKWLYHVCSVIVAGVVVVVDEGIGGGGGGEGGYPTIIVLQVTVFPALLLINSITVYNIKL